MANNNKTIFQRLTDIIIGTGRGSGTKKDAELQDIAKKEQDSDIIYSFDSKEERDNKLLQLKQQKLLSYQWKKVGYDSNMDTLKGGTQVRLMYRDADLMDQWPDISSALDIISEEATVIKNGKMLNVYSKSERIKSILEDLFINRLDINVMLPMIVRDTCKYGNEFMFLNIDQNNGIIGWRQLEIHQMRRIEDGLGNMYGSTTPSSNLYNLKPDEVKFIWDGHNESSPFLNWQVAHFRLIKNSLYLPYGVSVLNGARRHWRLLSMMEDAMFLHRLEKSVERRIYKVNVGAMDEADVPAFLQEFANTFKRAPIVDPKTGQIDLRKNFLDVSADYFIPVRPGQESTTIETLQGSQTPQTMEDIKYMENKILSILKVPKTFLNFQDSQGKGQNLALMDIRFNRMVNSIQQTILMELTKIAIIHLYLLGFEEELTNFTLTLNNPSNQIELMELDNMTKRVTLANAALTQQDCGIPLMSWYDVQKQILGKTDNEISDMLNQIRLESAISGELQNTSQIITKTGVFNKADRLYATSEPTEQAQGDVEDKQGGQGMGGSSMPPMDFGEEGGDFGGEGGDFNGEEGTEDLSNMGDEGEPLQENKSKSLINENVFENYRKEILKGSEVKINRPKIIDKTLMINEELMSKLNELEKINSMA